MFIRLLADDVEGRTCMTLLIMGPNYENTQCYPLDPREIRKFRRMLQQEERRLIEAEWLREDDEVEENECST